MARGHNDAEALILYIRYFALSEARLVIPFPKVMIQSHTYWNLRVGHDEPRGIKESGN